MTCRPRPSSMAFPSRFLFLACAAAIAFASAPAASPTEDREADSKITSVTVYANRAMVERTARARLEPGRHRVTFAGLPSTADMHSFRVSGRAPFALTILGSETKRIFHKEAVDERIKAIREKILAAEASKSEVQARLDVVGSQKAFVESVRSTTGDLLSRELALGKMDTESWRGAYDFLGSSLEDLAVRRLALDARMKELNAELDLLNQELRMVQRTSADVSFDAVAEVEVGSPGGEAELSLTYLVSGASWWPSYDARLLLDEGAVEMTTYGVVTQKTGEDWNDVALSLSTARPATGAAPPPLEAWYLEPVRSAVYETESATEEPAAGEAREKRVDEEAEVLLPPAELQAALPVALQSATVAAATLVDRAGVTATYDIAARAKVPADGTPIKTVIGSASFEPKLEHATTPVMAEKVYLSSEMKNDSEYAFLPGKVDVFVGPDMVGVQRVNVTTVPGEIFQLSFGVDPEVKVKREMIKEERSKPGKKMTLRREFTTTITNNKKDPVEVTVKDRVPISRSKEIRVDVEKMEPEPDSVGADGIAEWTIRLAPGEEAQITLEYGIAYPGGVAIPGL